ncbi:MAG: UDP-N-acetylglucosamine 1-carboxyvinyltransferase [Bacillota bacterium]|nr:UDP-N-acetylglucosamine 1-carboxyvinyltransferase [Bacillota bacterium]
MNRLVMTGGQKLCGEISVEGAKNAVLPILVATVLNGGINVIKNCPRLKDVDATIEILKIIGCKISREGNVVIVDSSTANNTVIPEELATEMRSSIIFMGAILAKLGKVTISYPGVCVYIRVQSPYCLQFFNNLLTNLRHSVLTIYVMMTCCVSNFN